MKFRFECEEFPLLPTKFGSKFQPIQGWESFFFIVRVYDVVQVTSKLLIHREKRIKEWHSILPRWSTMSHTIITSWGGIIFTLEDANILLELPCFQKYNICSLELSKKEKQMKELFSNLFKSECERSNWIGMFHQKFNSINGKNSFPEFLEHKYESEASLVMWLARHIFLEHLDHGISLDIVHGRLSACAPPPNLSPSPATFSNKFVGNNYRVWLWHNQKSKGKSFNFCTPLVDSRKHIKHSTVTQGDISLCLIHVSSKKKNQMDEEAAMFLLPELLIIQRIKTYSPPK
ncbi:hypothetical protein ES288_A10G138000v1 [Gossypium darwinii]|uniref:Aminotransferase-like plant mobile domain-containing protein n=1 Tax=Gossypium darwinii TaxID=34276 RepID=A0A5D2EZW4_GOSDA|nr:hypothetical protein ES288_A10G138000v1 [Gossypium darwinii]